MPPFATAGIFAIACNWVISFAIPGFKLRLNSLINNSIAPIVNKKKGGFFKYIPLIKKK